MFWNEFIAGNLGGLCGIIIVYPLDTAKIRMQTSPHYRNMFHVTSSMASKDGLSSLYRGIPSPALGFGFTFAISFAAYGQGCRTIARLNNKETKQLTPLEQAAAGAYTGFIQTPARHIVERVKSVMQVQETSSGKCRYCSLCRNNNVLIPLIGINGVVHVLWT